MTLAVLAGIPALGVLVFMVCSSVNSAADDVAEHSVLMKQLVNFVQLISLAGVPPIPGIFGVALLHAWRTRQTSQCG